MLAASVFTHLTASSCLRASGLSGSALFVAGASTGLLDRRVLGLGLMGFVAGGVLSILAYLPIIPGIIENAATVAQTSDVDVMQEYQSPLWTIFEALRTVWARLAPMMSLAGVAVGF